MAFVEGGGAKSMTSIGAPDGGRRNSNSRNVRGLRPLGFTPSPFIGGGPPDDGPWWLGPPGPLGG